MTFNEDLPHTKILSFSTQVSSDLKIIKSRGENHLLTNFDQEHPINNLDVSSSWEFTSALDFFLNAARQRLIEDYERMQGHYIKAAFAFQTGLNSSDYCIHWDRLLVPELDDWVLFDAQLTEVEFYNYRGLKDVDGEKKHRFVRAMPGGNQKIFYVSTQNFGHVRKVVLKKNDQEK